MAGFQESGSSQPGLDASPIEAACIPWQKLTDTEHGSITQGILRADHTFRFMSPEGAQEASRRHREAIGLMLKGLGAAEPGVSRHGPDKVAVALADFVAHLHDDLPLPERAQREERMMGHEVISEAEYLGRAAVGKAFVDSYKRTHAL